MREIGIGAKVKSVVARRRVDRVVGHRLGGDGEAYVRRCSDVWRAKPQELQPQLGHDGLVVM